MEKMSFFCYHNIIRMSIAYSDDVRSHAIPSTTEFEILDCFLFLFLIWVVVFYEFQNRSIDQAPKFLVVQFMDTRSGFTIPNNLEHTYLIQCCYDIVRLHT